MFARTIAQLTILGALVAGGAGYLQPSASLAHPATLSRAAKTYRNGSYGFSIKYPSSWHTKKNKNFLLEVIAPDGDAVVTADAFKGNPSRSQIVANELKVLKSVGSFVKPAQTSNQKIHGVVFVLTGAAVKDSSGSVLAAFVLDTTKGGNVYAFNALVVANKPNFKKETNQVVNAFNSIRIQ